MSCKQIRWRVAMITHRIGQEHSRSRTIILWLYDFVQSQMPCCGKTLCKIHILENLPKPEKTTLNLNWTPRSHWETISETYRMYQYTCAPQPSLHHPFRGIIDHTIGTTYALKHLLSREFLSLLSINPFLTYWYFAKVYCIYTSHTKNTSNIL